MDPIADLDTLRGHLDALAGRGLVVWLSPPGRGRMLTHGLLPAEKLEKVRAQLGMVGTPVMAATETPGRDAADAAVGRGPVIAAVAAVAVPAEAASLERRVAELEAALAELRDRLAALENR